MQTMYLSARSMIGPRHAERIARAFGRSLQDLNVRPRPITTLYRSNFNEGDEHAPVIPVAELVCALADITMELPYYSTGSNMTYNAHRALRILAAQVQRKGARIDRRSAASA